MAAVSQEGQRVESVELASPQARGFVGEEQPAREWFRRPRNLFALASVTLLLVVVAVVLAVVLSSRSEPRGYTCESPLRLGKVAAAEKKGLAVDDTTFLGCPASIPAVWPNSESGVGSIRLFKAWDSSWPSEKRRAAWQRVADFVQRNGAKVLIGAQITCNEANDDADWANVLELLKMLGPKHVMGVAIGNELELLQFKDKASVPDACVKNIWEGGYLLRKFDEHVRDLDSLDGFNKVPLTSAFGGAIMATSPFWNTPTAMVLDFFQKVTAKYGPRWVYSLNVYPYFDPSNQLDAGSTDRCSEALGRSLCWSDPASCLFPGIVQSMRERMRLVSAQNDVLWITETGWSSPMSETLKDKPISACPKFSDESALRSYYQGFLSWDMQIKGSEGPDHVFYFTVRDSTNFGATEFFGLIEDCDAVECKLQEAGGQGPAPSPSPPAPAPRPGPAPAAACSANPACKTQGLQGNCCPTDGGVTLGCCPVAACEAHPKCHGMWGNCCPTDGGERLWCCD
mmetsp:Transcript_53755/g.149129  ORF Transcript_53755/g.149129 Transcript_53755/m.149129 type:complete len:512 (-) Transcript_53755:133-1668(-)